MAYAFSGLQCFGSGGLGAQRRLWTYRSADILATVQGSNYFSDSGVGGKVQMTVGDICFVTVSGTNVTTTQTVSAVSATGATVV